MSSRILRNKILVVGDVDIGLLDFVKGIFKACEIEFPQELVDKELEKSDGTHSGICIPWTIETKYYTAPVVFWLDEIPNKAHEATAKEYTKDENGLREVVDAFVYVFDKHKPDTFEGIKHWLPFLERCEPSVLLCVSGVKETTDESKDSSSIEEWCLDHQFEYVDLQEKTVEPLDKAGWDLAVDVLQTNLWDGMTQKEQDNAKVNENKAGKSLFKESVYDKEDDDFYEEFEKLKLEQDQATSSERKSSIIDDLDDDLDMPTESEIRRMQEHLFGDIDKEDGLDKALETMRALREQGKNLPDDERRKLAAKVALSFAAQLGV